MPSSNVSGNTNWTFTYIGEPTTATATGASNSATITLSYLVVEANATTATSTGAAQDASVAIYVSGGNATASGVANNTSITVVITLQYIRPASDLIITGWTTQIGGTTNLYATLDEAIEDDADYIVAVMSP